MQTVNIKEAEPLLMDIIRAGLVGMLWSSPGMGKSDLARAIAKKYNLFVIDLRLSQMDPTDLNGFPTYDKDTMRSHYAPPMAIPLEGDPIPDGYDGWLVFFDEINSAAPSMQAASYKVILDKKVGEHNVHKNVAMLAAGNLATDRAIVHTMSTALQSRMIHVVLEACENIWNSWANVKELDYRVIGFLRFRSELLHKFDPKHNDLTFACPRTWEFVSRLIKPWKTIPSHKVALLAGTVGEGAAIEFKGFTDCFQELPERTEIIDHPATAKIPTEPSTMYAVSALLSSIIDEANITKVMVYLERLPIEFQTISLQGVFKRFPLLPDHKAVEVWLARNAGELL